MNPLSKNKSHKQLWKNSNVSSSSFHSSAQSRKSLKTQSEKEEMRWMTTSKGVELASKLIAKKVDRKVSDNWFKKMQVGVEMGIKSNVVKIANAEQAWKKANRDRIRKKWQLFENSFTKNILEQSRKQQQEKIAAKRDTLNQKLMAL